MSDSQMTAKQFHTAVEAASMLVVEFSVSPDALQEDHPLAREFPAATFARIDPSREREIAAMFGLGEEPALLIFRDRVVLYLEAGEHSIERTGALLRQVAALDMDRVRSDLDRERAEAAVHMQRMCPAARRGPMPPSGA
jgi:hypothetical protein